MAAATTRSTTSCSTRVVGDTHCDCAGARNLPSSINHCVSADIVSQATRCRHHTQKGNRGWYTLLLLRLYDNLYGAHGLLFPLSIPLQREDGTSMAIKGIAADCS